MPLPLLAKYVCSRATSPQRAGCSARDETLPISENDALFTLIGTMYGGDGQETFQLPNLPEPGPDPSGTGPGWHAPTRWANSPAWNR